MPDSNWLIYVMRRDLRISDNPILNSLSCQSNHGFTHLLPLYVFPAQQIEVSGFIPSANEETKSPYPEAKSRIGGFWRCGPHRAKFLAGSVYDVKGALEGVGSGLCIRVGMVGEVVRKMLEEINRGQEVKVGSVWMTAEEGVEEKREEREVKRACEAGGAECKIWGDEKYFIDDRDIPFNDPQELPDVFTTYRKLVEPLREAPRPALAHPTKHSLPPFPPGASIPPQHSPFVIPTTYQDLLDSLLNPLNKTVPLILNPPSYPKDTQSAHPFQGGESHAQKRLNHLITSGLMSTYKETRNGLLGTDFSTKLSAWLALGCITARQIHAALISLEDGKEDGDLRDVEGYGKGPNEGTTAVRFELLWRDYMRLCSRKFGHRLFRLKGFRQEDVSDAKWLSPNDPGEVQGNFVVEQMLERFLNGTTGMGFIDASQREIFHTGYTSNRARQNVASFMAKHLHLDWRLGAEWYECMLVDYDASSNWGNWQYVAGVGNDPRGGARVFNPVKQAFDYDPQGEYVMAWVEELRGLKTPGEVFQAWTIKDEVKKRELGLLDLAMVKNPLKRIEFTIGRLGHLAKGRDGTSGLEANKPSQRTDGRGIGAQSRGRYGGRGYGSSRGHVRRGYGRGRGGGGIKEVSIGVVDPERAVGTETVK